MRVGDVEGYIGTKAYGEAAMWAVGGSASNSSTPKKGGSKEAGHSQSPRVLAAHKGAGSNSRNKGTYATNYSAYAQEKKAKGTSSSNGKTCWVIWDFGDNPTPPKHHIFDTWFDKGEMRGAKFFIDNWSKVEQRKFTAKTPELAVEKATEYLAEKEIRSGLVGNSLIVDFPEWRAQAKTADEGSGSDMEVEEGEVKGDSWGRESQAFQKAERDASDEDGGNRGEWKQKSMMKTNST